jgi:hypothetical protein
MNFSRHSEVHRTCEHEHRDAVIIFLLLAQFPDNYDKAVHKVYKDYDNGVCLTSIIFVRQVNTAKRSQHGSSRKQLKFNCRSAGPNMDS